ncbi:MAG TPA: DUF4058 family protein [Pirellulales bacterium]|nr:DUF4058 family protein [Pirellulales bacterium]
MPSPFPGMDPYLEQSACWRDFHLTFINYLRNAINDRLPPKYDARIEERIVILDSFDRPSQWFESEVAVAQQSSAGTAIQAPPSVPGLLEPTTVPLIIPERERQRYIEIYDYPEQLLVTVIEVLSPTNKLSRGRDDYLTKRDAILNQDVHLIELDLLVGGQRLPAAEPLPADDYYAFVARAERRPLCDVYHWNVRQPLPAIPIPLKPPDPDVIIELQPVFTEVFARGRYERRLRYAKPPRSRLSRADRQWAAELAAAFSAKR